MRDRWGLDKRVALPAERTELIGGLSWFHRDATNCLAKTSRAFRIGRGSGGRRPEWARGPPMGNGIRGELCLKTDDLRNWCTSALSRRRRMTRIRMRLRFETACAWSLFSNGKLDARWASVQSPCRANCVNSGDCISPATFGGMPIERIRHAKARFLRGGMRGICMKHI